jgi:hypothetical protein
MTKILRFAIIIWTTFIGLALPTQSLARLYVPSSFAILSDDAQLLLVMRSPIKIEWDEGRIFKLPSGQEINLREKFTTNGVFRLDNFECVLPLDWFADGSELFASEDFNILVRLNQFAVETKNKTNWCWCLKFYSKGKEVKQYKVKDLVEIPHFFFLPFTSDGWHTVWYATAMYTSSSAFIDIAHSYNSYFQFILVTAPQSFGRIHLSDGNVFLFNARTGEIVQQWRHHPLIKFSIGVISFLAFFLLLIFLCVRSLRKFFRRRIKKSEAV